MLEKSLQEKKSEKSIPYVWKQSESEKKWNVIVKSPDFSETSVTEQSSFAEFSGLRKTRCNTKDFYQNESNNFLNISSQHLVYNFKRAKRLRPNSWIEKSPKKKFLQEIALSQLPLFRF